MFFRKKPDKEKIMMVGTYILFILQNNFFTRESEDNIKHVFDSCVKKYVNKESYNQFLLKHKNLTEPLINGDLTLIDNAKAFIPAEPSVYPITVEIAQKKYPEHLLDIVSLEVLYYLVGITAMINKQYGELSQSFFPYFFNLFDKIVGWSEDGVNKAWAHGGKRYDEYAELLISSDGKDFGGLASKNIFGKEDAFAALYLDNYIYSIDYYAEVLKKL